MMFARYPFLVEASIEMYDVIAGAVGVRGG